MKFDFTKMLMRKEYFENARTRIIKDIELLYQNSADIFDNVKIEFRSDIIIDEINVLIDDIIKERYNL